MADEAAQTSSLYTPFTRPFELNLDELYRRDTNELIKPYLDIGLKLTMVAQRVHGYFAHGEAKSQGSVGLLERTCVIGLSKTWIGKESHPYADTEENPDDETLETYKTGVAIVSKSLNHDLNARAGVAELAKAARIDEKVLLDVVMNKKDLRADLKARLFKAITVTPEGRIEVVKVPISRQETDLELIGKMITTNKRARILGQFIHAAKALEGRARYSAAYDPDCDVAKIVEVPPNGNWNGYDATHKKIFADIDRVCARCPPVFLTLKEIEPHAKNFYGIEKGLKKKSDRKARQTEYFKTTAHKARERWYKSRAKERGHEIKRVAEFWGMPEIKGAKNVKHAHLLDKDLNKIASTKCYDGSALKPAKIVCSPIYATTRTD